MTDMDCVTPFQVAFLGRNCSADWEALLHQVASRGGRWTASRISDTGGWVTGSSTIELPSDRCEGLQEWLGDLSDLHVVLVPALAREPARATLDVCLIGSADHLLPAMTTFLQTRGVRLEELEADVAPASGREALLAFARLVLPVGMGPAELEEELTEWVAGEVFDITFVHRDADLADEDVLGDESSAEFQAGELQAGEDPTTEALPDEVRAGSEPAGGEPSDTGREVVLEDVAGLDMPAMSEAVDILREHARARRARQVPGQPVDAPRIDLEAPALGAPTVDGPQLGAPVPGVPEAGIPMASDGAPMVLRDLTGDDRR